jgi:hypothetical protein
MRRSFSFVSAFLVVAAITLSARPADARVEIAKFKIRDKSLEAVFDSADGCFVATTTLKFTSSITQTSGPPVVTPPLTTVEVAYSNGCTGEFFILTGGTNNQVVNIAPDLSSATLSAVVPVTDGLVNANVTVNARFTANGPLERAKDHTITREGNTITLHRIDFRARSADMTGSSLSTVLPLAAGPTFLDLSQSSVGGELGRDLEGTKTITFLRWPRR